MKEIKEKAPKDIIIGIAGNKYDLESEVEVDVNEAEEYASVIFIIIIIVIVLLGVKCRI